MLARRVRLPFLSALLVSFLMATLLASPRPVQAFDVAAAVDQAGASCKAAADKIYEFKEQGSQEFKSSELLKSELTKLGFTVTGDLKVPDDLIKGGVSKTAFKAVMNGKGPGPTVCIMLEYDALANGHACGHNLISGSGLMAAAALAKAMPQTPGKLVVMGTPDEERGSAGGGKIALLEGGHFEGVDAVLITHPADRFSLDQRLLAMKRVTFTFKGKSAHAASAPHKGINALDAVILTFNGVSLMRQQLRDDVRVHGIVLKGGEKVNVIPELAQAEFAVRALDTKTMEETFARVVNCAKAAELATGTKLEFKEPRVFVTASVPDKPLLDALELGLKTAGVDKSQLKNFTEFVSSDLGSVGYAFPTVNLWFKVAPDGTALHSDAMREAAGTPEAWKATVTAGKAIALTAYDLLTHPDKVQAVKKAFAESKGK